MGRLAALKVALLGEPLELPAQLLHCYPELQLARYRRGGLPPRLGGWVLGQPTAAGIALWRTVFLAPGATLTAELLLHELRHVQQFEASAAFPLRYLWESVRRGYWRNRYEADARLFASERLHPAGANHPSQDA